MSRAALLALCLAFAAEARACSVPVFRFALEKWKPSAYDVVVFNHGPLTASHLASLARLREEGGPANVAVTVIDCHGEIPSKYIKLCENHVASKTPLVVVRYPDAAAGDPPLFSTPLDETFVAGIVSSPTRDKVAERLCRGDAVVWVLLESGERAEDDKAAAMASRELARLEKDIVIPPRKVEDGPPLIDLPLVASFPFLRLSRTPEEAAFVAMLLGTDEALAAVKGPILFPVFGRGRVLHGLYGKKLTPASLDYWASYLTGGCSCAVKELNPGTDLLMAVDWAKRLNVVERPERETLPAVAPAIPPGDVEKSLGEVCGTADANASSGMAVSLALGALLVVGVVAMVLARGSA